MISFECDPDQYQHWKVSYSDSVATLAMDVTPTSGLVPGYELKLNSYDLGVDIELYDILQRLRFEQPGIQVVILTSAKDKNFCAGANIKMLAQSSHQHKVNFCKFTNETRNSIEDASRYSGLKFICALNGTAAGGGYELALAADHIILIDDGNATVSLPELPLLAVLPGTGGLTRLVDKRFVRHDHADYFCTKEEGIGGKRALQWNLVDAIAPPSEFQAAVDQCAAELISVSNGPAGDAGIELKPLNKSINDGEIRYDLLRVVLDRNLATATICIDGPSDSPPGTADEMLALGSEFWSLALCRQLDDLILHLRANEAEIGSFVFKSSGDIALVAAYDQFLVSHQQCWLARETLLYWKRTLKRLDVTSRSIVSVIEPGSCFAGTLLEIVLASDRSFMLDGEYEGNDLPPPTVQLTAMNFGPLPKVNDITRLQSRSLDDPEFVVRLEQRLQPNHPCNLLAAEALEQRLVTFTPDDIDWDDEIRLCLEERAGFSPDALTGMEANLRFAGPETMESKIFARLTAWQNWIFQRPNAVGEKGALISYGTGNRSQFDNTRV